MRVETELLWTRRFVVLLLAAIGARWSAEALVWFGG